MAGKRGMGTPSAAAQVKAIPEHRASTFSPPLMATHDRARPAVALHRKRDEAGRAGSASAGAVSQTRWPPPGTRWIARHRRRTAAPARSLPPGCIELQLVADAEAVLDLDLGQAARGIPADHLAHQQAAPGSRVAAQVVLVLGRGMALVEAVGSRGWPGPSSSPSRPHRSGPPSQYRVVDRAPVALGGAGDVVGGSWCGPRSEQNRRRSPPAAARARSPAGPFELRMWCCARPSIGIRSPGRVPSSSSHTLLPPRWPDRRRAPGPAR